MLLSNVSTYPPELHPLSNAAHFCSLRKYQFNPNLYIVIGRRLHNETEPSTSDRPQCTHIATNRPSHSEAFRSYRPAKAQNRRPQSRTLPPLSKPPLSRPLRKSIHHKIHTHTHSDHFTDTTTMYTTYTRFLQPHRSKPPGTPTNPKSRATPPSAPPPTP